MSATLRELGRSRPSPTRGVDDLVSMLVDFESGVGRRARGQLGAARHKCDLGFDLVCEHGALRFSWERSNELGVLAGDVADPTTATGRC